MAEPFYVVEVRGVEPRSLNNLIKAATCLAPYFTLILATPAGRDLQAAALRDFIPPKRANYAGLA